MATTNLNIRTDKEIKEQAEQILSDLGLNMTTAVNMFLRSTIRENGIPFDLKLAKKQRKSLDKLFEVIDILSNGNPLDAKYHDHELTGNYKGMAKRIKSFSACSGRFTSSRLALVLAIPTRKNKTSRASPMACTAPLMFRITFQIPPPLNDSGDMVRSCQTSASFSFHVFSAFWRFCTTQLSLTGHHLRNHCISLNFSLPPPTI